MGLLDLPYDFLFSRLVNVSPVVTIEGKLLIVKSNWRAQVLSLGFGARKIVVDTQSRIVRLRIRRFWFFTHMRRIEFDWVAHILYRYAEMSSATALSWSYHSSDLFTVSLILKNGEMVNLCRFFGEGEFVNAGPLPDWWYWQDRIEAKVMQGNQDSDSLALVDALSRAIGVPIENE